MKTALKTCFKCGAAKPRTEFYAHSQMGDGLLGKCKDCTKRDVRVNRRIRQDYYAEYDRKRGNRVTKELMDRHKIEHPVETKARYDLSNAVRSGKVSREPCFMCGRQDGRIHGHHVDYTKPLDVVWLCVRCHRRIHAYEDLASKIREKRA